jgi:hypothetical protein
MPVDSPSFLSYSRKDYYFAESLAFHAAAQRPRVAGRQGSRTRQGLGARARGRLDAATAVVLVASPDSMESPNVRNEWQRALRQGRGSSSRASRREIPAELQQCESVDFRPPFGRALRASSHLTPAAPTAAARVRREPARPGSGCRRGLH